MNLFTWRGQPIEDIEQWAKAHHEKMVDVTFKIKQVNPYAGKNAISYVEETKTMPVPFWNNLRMSDQAIPIRVIKREPISHEG